MTYIKQTQTFSFSVNYSDEILHYYGKIDFKKSHVVKYNWDVVNAV